MGLQAFQLRCDNRELAEEIMSKIEEMGFVIEPYGEKKRQRRHKKGSKIDTVLLIVNLPEGIQEGTPEMHAMWQELGTLTEQYPGVSLVL